MSPPNRIGMCEISKDEIRGALAEDNEDDYEEFTRYSNVAILENDYEGVPEVLGQVEEPSKIEYREPDKWAEETITKEFEENMSTAIRFLYGSDDPKDQPVVLNPEFL